PLQGLHQVRVDGVAEEGGHGSGDLEVGGDDGAAIEGEGEQDAVQARLEVGQVLGQAEERHHLGGGGDQEAFLAGIALQPPPQPEHRLPKGAVVHVHGPAEEDLPGIDAERVGVEELVVEAGRQQIVGALDGVDVAGEVKVDVVSGDELGPPAPGAAAL